MQQFIITQSLQCDVKDLLEIYKQLKMATPISHYMFLSGTNDWSTCCVSKLPFQFSRFFYVPTKPAREN